MTVAIQGSVDLSDWFPIAYAGAATPETVSVATFTIITATTVREVLRPFHPWRFLQLTYSSKHERHQHAHADGVLSMATATSTSCSGSRHSGHSGRSGGSSRGC